MERFHEIFKDIPYGKLKSIADFIKSLKNKDGTPIYNF